MTMGYIATAVAVKTATNVLTRKILGDPEAPAQIGSGTVPKPEAGAEMDIAPVEGSEVQSFGEFTTDDPTQPTDPDQMSMLMEQLNAAGLDPSDLENYGIAGMYLGGYLNRSLGGGLGIMDLLTEADFAVDMPLEIPEPDLEIEVDIPAPELPEPSTMQKLQAWIESQPPEVQKAIMSGMTDIGTAGAKRLISGKEKPKARVSRTQTLPGNANRRRQVQFKPIEGSSFADGGVLQRPMFMPNGGAMRGPGGPKDDLIPVMASNGEFMLSKAAVDQAGGGNHAKGIAALTKFNKLGNMRYG
jgi:hypothetical protein